MFESIKRALYCSIIITVYGSLSQWVLLLAECYYLARGLQQISMRTLITALKSHRHRRWKQGLLYPKAVISGADGRMAKLHKNWADFLTCSLLILGENSANSMGFAGTRKKEKARKPLSLLAFSMAEWVGFEPTVP